MVAENFAQGPYFGDFGGRFVAESLMGPLEEVEAAWKRLWRDKSFQRRLRDLFLNYAGRPSLLTEAPRFAADLGGVRVFLKREDLNHTGSHKINNVLGQALLTKELGKTRVIAETGAGQHGVATATAAALLGLDCTIYMGREDTERQALNVARMQMLGAEVIAVTAGSATLKDAINEAFRDWVTNVETGAGARPSACYRRRGARTAARRRGTPARRRRGLRGWRFQRHRILHRVHR